MSSYRPSHASRYIYSLGVIGMTWDNLHGMVAGDLQYILQLW